ncbi:hypothetical protein ACTFEU_03110, partial [Campylobacter jejuni]
LVFNEAPKLVRQLQKSDTVQRGIAQGIRLGMDVLAGAPPSDARALPAGRPISSNFVPTAHRARRVSYA